MIKLCKDNFGDTYCLAGIVGGNYQDHYYIRNSNGKTLVLSVAIEGTAAYDFQERERKENYTNVVFDKTFHQDCYVERYVVFDELPSNTPKCSKGHLDNNFVIEINKRMGSMPVPNIILNRYDLRYTNDDVYWVHIQEQLRSSTVGLRINANRAWIGILRMPISPNCLEEMIRKVFSVFPAVHNISFQFTRFNPKLLWPNALFKESSFCIFNCPKVMRPYLQGHQVILEDASNMSAEGLKERSVQLELNVTLPLRFHWKSFNCIYNINRKNMTTKTCIVVYREF